MKNLIYISLLFSIISCTQERTCKDLHEGEFNYADPELSHIEITRSSNSQIEINTETKIEAHTNIEWISDCEYVLTYKEFKNAPEEINFMVGKKIEAEIIDINGNNFTCQVRTDDTDESMEFKIAEE
jgi:hypothetical protein